MLRKNRTLVKGGIRLNNMVIQIKEGLIEMQCARNESSLFQLVRSRREVQRKENRKAGNREIYIEGKRKQGETGRVSGEAREVQRRDEGKSKEDIARGKTRSRRDGLTKQSRLWR